MAKGHLSILGSELSMLLYERCSNVLNPMTGTSIALKVVWQYTLGYLIDQLVW